MEQKKHLKYFITNCLFIILSIVSVIPVFSEISVDVSENLDFNKGLFRYDRRIGMDYFDVSLTNNSDKTLIAPFHVVIDSISDERVTVRNPDGYTVNNNPYYEFSYPDILEPGMTTEIKQWEFLNPERVRYNFTLLEILGKIKLIQPEVSITADPIIINNGESSILTWESKNADTCIIEPNIGAVDINGSLTVTPNETTIYTVTASNSCGNINDSVEITVNSLSGNYLNISESIINYGDSVTLTWNTEQSQKNYFNNDIGEVDNNGSLILTPEYTTTYILTSVNDTQTINQSISVKVIGNLPEPQPEGRFGEQYNDLIPSDASLESYDTDRFIVLTGIVEDINGDPINDVKIEIIDHSEYGSVLTDDTGRFSIPAEGGTLVKLVYTKENFLTVHRRIEAQVNDIVTIETVTLLTRDTSETNVTFDGNPETIITHKSTEYTDDSGSRSCTLVFSGDNKAYELDKYGNRIRELSSITTRTTEYVKPETMPSKLPSNSAFTYCVEMEADNIERIEFEKPVINYVNNFLGFNVGDIVPVGYYDRDLAEWVPSDNGVVVKLLDIDSNGIIDSLDADGDDLPDDLNGDGSTIDEVSGLNDSVYKAGDTYWRVNIKHFTPWDHNWPYLPPDDAIFPNPDTPPTTDDKKPDEPITCSGSYVENKSRIMNEDINIMGTDMTLHYSSNNTLDYKKYINVPVSGDTIPSSLKRIIVNCEIAGKYISKSVSAIPNQKTQFIWDGFDYRGNKINNPVNANISIGFVYDGVYGIASDRVRMAFSQPGIETTLIVNRKEFVTWDHISIKIEPLLFKTNISNGWSISSQHQLMKENPYILYKGDGSKLQNNVKHLIDTVAGNGEYSDDAYGDGGLVTDASFSQMRGIEFDEQGNLYIADAGAGRIRKVDNNGIVTTIAGTGISGNSGDGGPATEATFRYPSDIALDKFGNYYIADQENNSVRKVDINGIISTIAGNGLLNSSFIGNNGPAVNSGLGYPESLATDQYGNLFISDSYLNYIYKIDTSGIITIIAGTGKSDYDGDGGLAINADLDLRKPTDLTIDLQGNLYFSDDLNRCIRKIDKSGIINTVFSSNYNSDFYINSLTIDKNENLYFGDGVSNSIYMININGDETKIAGNGVNGFGGDGGPATKAMFTFPTSIIFDSKDNLYAVDKFNYRIRKIGKPAMFFKIMNDEDFGFIDENGLSYIMDKTGKHKKTIDLVTGKTLKTFEYELFNGENKLTSIIDQFGNIITINRDSEGKPNSIISHDGLETLLTVDSNNNLINIKSPDNSSYNFTYSPGGLLTEKIEPNSNTFNYVYNEIGRLTETYDENGGRWLFDRYVDNNGMNVNTVTSAEGNIIKYEDYYHLTGKYTSEITDSMGGKTYFTKSADELNIQKSLSCGMEIDINYDIDPEYKYKIIKDLTKTTPYGIENVIQQDVVYEDTDNDDIPDFITKNISVNGKTSIFENDIISSTKTITTPEGRQTTVNYDPDTLVVTNSSIPGLNNIDYSYDSKGRTETITTGTRKASFTYDSNGYINSVTNPLNQTINYTNDKAGRIIYTERPDGSTFEFSYDPNGNMTMFTNPGSIDHTFGYNKVSLRDNYDTPISGSYSYIYDKDRRQIQKNFPSGKSIYFDYTNPENPSDKSRLQQIVTPEGVIDFSYLCTSKIGSVTKDSETIMYDYDGSLITSISLSGILNQDLSLTYNNDFNVETFTYAGDTVNYTYDNDGLLTSSGNYTISLNADNGLPESFTDNTFTLSRVFNGYGELTNQYVNINSHDLFSYDLIYNDNGQITNKTEIIDGVSSNYIYTYDTMGRLLTTTKNGELVEEYGYDLIGTRNYEMNSLRDISERNFTYSDEDHLLTAGTNSYQYDSDGFLTSKTVDTETTTFDYSSRGELLNVVLPDLRNISYEHDPMGRRIAKKIDGVITEKYLWSGLTTLLAVFDGNDNIINRFEYADERMPVSMMKEGIKYYLIYDQIGSLKLVVDSSGNIEKQIDYDSFGNVINDTNSVFSVPFGFAGGLYDIDTGLVRFGYRDYDTDIGRWTAKDPIVFDGGDSDLYGYVLNDPINFIDPEGLWRLSFSFGGGFTAGIGWGKNFSAVAGSYSFSFNYDSNKGLYKSGSLQIVKFDEFYGAYLGFGKQAGMEIGGKSKRGLCDPESNYKSVGLGLLGGGEVYVNSSPNSLAGGGGRGGFGLLGYYGKGKAKNVNYNAY